MKKFMPLVLTLLLGTTACSTILRTEVYRLDPTKSVGWVTHEIQRTTYSLRQESLTLIVYDIHPTLSLAGSTYSVSIGPIFLPIIPLPLLGRKFYPFHLGIEVENTQDATDINFYEAEIQFFREKPVRPRAVYTVEPTSKDEYCYDYTSIKECYHGSMLQPRRITLPKGKSKYELDFFKVPHDAKVITVNLGRIQINAQQIELPPLEYHKITKYRYMPLFFGD
jgi:hypothetical protein